jgi:hypothetical protein
MKTPRLLALALAAALALPSHAPAQARQQGPIFGTGIEIINLQPLGHRRPQQLRDRPGAARLRGVRGRHPPGLSLFTHENLPISMVLMLDTSASMEEKLKTAQDAGDPLHENAQAAGPRAGGAVQRAGDAAADLHERPRRAREGDPLDRGLGPDRRSTTRSTSRSRT